MKIYLKNENAKIPTLGSIGSAGYDLYSTESNVILPFQSTKFNIGIHLEIPDGMYGNIKPRSGLDIKSGIGPIAGVIDSDYTGEIIVALYNKSNKEYMVSIGDRIAQIIFQKYEKMKIHQVYNLDELTTTERGENGFGSTG